MEIVFGPARLLLRPSGTLYWPAQETLVVADMHLEKGSFAAISRGVLLPPHDTHDTLSRLLAELNATRPARLLLLGDSLHDNAGLNRMASTDRNLLDRILQLQETIWLHGNHDAQISASLSVAMEHYHLAGIDFMHEASDGEGFEVSGHYHPVASIRHKGISARQKVFAVNGGKLIMPSFGTYTGGLDVDDPACAGVLGSAPLLYACGTSRVFLLPAMPTASQSQREA